MLRHPVYTRLSHRNVHLEGLNATVILLFSCSMLYAATLVSSAGQPDSEFKVGMKLEAVDRRFPYFVCVATVMDRSGMSYTSIKQGEVSLHKLVVPVREAGPGRSLGARLIGSMWKLAGIV